MWLFLTLVTVLIVYLYHHFTKYNNFWKERNVPGPKPTFFFGNLKDLALRKRSICEIYKEICDQYPNEKVVGIFRMRTPDLIVKDLDIIMHILIKDFYAFTERGLAYDEKDLGANLLHATGDTWKALRNRFTPVFTPWKLRNMMYLMIERADKLVDYIDKITTVQPEQDAHELVKMFTHANIAACVLGVNVDSFEEHKKTLQWIEEKIFKITYNTELDMMYPGILRKLGFSIFPKEVKEFFLKLTKDVISKRNGEPSGKNDFVDLILELRKIKQITTPVKHNDDIQKILDVTDDIIASQVFIFYLAGYEASATTMAFLLYELAVNPDIQDKVVAEINEVLEKHNGEYTLEAVSDLHYMGRVFDETLRIHLLVERLRRRAQVDYKVPGMDLVIKKGVSVIIPVNVIHFDERIYPNPEKFDPDRFSPDNKSARHSCAFLSFGHGQRQCIGSRFAQVQSRVCIAKLLSKYRVEPTENTPKRTPYVPGRFLQCPTGGIPLKFTKRR